jgi:hypothetical protein
LPPYLTMPLTYGRIDIMNNTDTAYIAGLFDGEGSITLARLEHKVWRKRTDFFLVVRIHNTRRPVLEWVTSTVGKGKVYTSNHHPTGGHNEVFQWHITGPSAIAFLLDVKPYIKIKNTQIELACLFQATKEKVGSKRQFRFGVPPEVSHLRFSLYEQMKAANRRGTVPIVESPGVSGIYSSPLKLLSSISANTM